MLMDAGWRFYLVNRRRLHAGAPCWWKAEGRGYTDDVREAGKYTTDEVFAVMSHAGGEDAAGDFPVPVDMIDVLRLLFATLDQRG